jgi:hypothetical protein
MEKKDVEEKIVASIINLNEKKKPAPVTEEEKAQAALEDAPARSNSSGSVHTDLDWDAEE